MHIGNILRAISAITFALGLALLGGLEEAPFVAAKLSFVICLAAAASYLYWWGTTSDVPTTTTKLWVGIPTVFSLVTLCFVVTELIIYRSDQTLIQNAALNLGALPNSEIRSRASKLIERMKEFDITNELTMDEMISEQTTRGASSNERDELFKKHSAKILSNIAQNDGAWRIYYLPELQALLDTARERLGGAAPQPSSEAAPALRGMLAGPYPASAAADYLASVVRMLPQ